PAARAGRTPGSRPARAPAPRRFARPGRPPPGADAASPTRDAGTARAGAARPRSRAGGEPPPRIPGAESATPGRLCVGGIGPPDNTVGQVSNLPTQQASWKLAPQCCPTGLRPRAPPTAVIPRRAAGLTRPLL